MEKITITFDNVGNTPDVWFEKPRPCINEELGNGVIIKKDESGDHRLRENKLSQTGNA